jgi:hypothetical protein
MDVQKVSRQIHVPKFGVLPKIVYKIIIQTAD